LSFDDHGETAGCSAFLLLPGCHCRHSSKAALRSQQRKAKQTKLISPSASQKREMFGCVLMGLLWRLWATEEHNSFLLEVPERQTLKHQSFGDTRVLDTDLLVTAM